MTHDQYGGNTQILNGRCRLCFIHMKKFISELSAILAELNEL